ncbi:MAG: ATP-binding cassette domain-containing protein [Candidatus Acidiferrales bacterium]|jgi:iron complex transport system ATP-binding protein
MEPALVDLKNVRVIRGDNIALDDFSLRIAAGEHIAILGPNGCGKSTLIKTITRECYPVYRKGSSMTILGQERWNIFELRTVLGIVSNDLMLDCTNETSGREVVLSGFFSSTRIFDHQSVQSSHLSRADAVLERLGVPHLADRPVAEMSSGEAKRILIARALVHDPQTLLFDEPSNSLDIFAQHGLRETMRELAQSGIGVVLVTHHLSDVIPEIDRVVLMRNGKILADGRKEELLEPAQISGLFGIRVDITRRDGHYHLW